MDSHLHSTAVAVLKRADGMSCNLSIYHTEKTDPYPPLQLPVGQQIHHKPKMLICNWQIDII